MTKSKTPQPDRTMRLDELTGVVHRIAAAMIARHGVYTFTDATTGEKVMVVK